MRPGAASGGPRVECLSFPTDKGCGPTEGVWRGERGVRDEEDEGVPGAGDGGGQAAAGLSQAPGALRYGQRTPCGASG